MVFVLKILFSISYELFLSSLILAYNTWPVYLKSFALFSKLPKDESNTLIL